MVLAACCSLPPPVAFAQQGRLSVVVEYVAGANLYLDAGGDDGIHAADTLQVYGGPSGSHLGDFVVISSSSDRAVVTFADRPFPVTRGDALIVALDSGFEAGRGDLMIGRIQLQPVDRSGARVDIVITDDGSALNLRVTTSGLRPGIEYVMRGYGEGSTARGRNACLPGDDDISYSLGTWSVDSAGERTLAKAFSDESYIPSSALRTIGLRDPAEDFALAACGTVETNPLPLFGRNPQAEPPSTAPTAASPARVNRTPGRSLEVNGRLALDVSVLESSTGSDLEPVDRRFTTPTARLRMAVTNLPGGFALNTNLRAAYHHATGGAIAASQSLRVYQASLAKSFGRFPLQFEAGRFYSPFETFSGYWDGLLVHLGTRSIGLGFAAGFEPQNSNEAFSTDIPKYTAYANLQHRSRIFSYSADLSFHALRPRTGFVEHDFFGFSQRLRWQRFSLSHRMQVDRDPATDAWRITQFDIRTAVPLGRRLTVLGQVSRLQPYYIWQIERPIAPARDRATIGVNYSLFSGTFGVDVTANRLQAEDISYTYAGHYSFPRTALLGLGFSGTASYWQRETITTLYLSQAVRRTFGGLQTQVSYQRYMTKSAARPVVTHGFDASFLLPISRRLFFTMEVRLQRGADLNSNNLYTGFWVSF
jgi:hypothetical protein